MSAHGRSMSYQARGRADELLGALRSARDVTPRLGRCYAVKGWLHLDSISVLWGESNVGKTFLALDLAHHLAQGRDWHGYRVGGGRVLYLALEGGETFENRVAALDRPEFWYLRAALTLFGPGSDASALVSAVARDAAERGPWRLIVVDTLARAMGSGDENAAADIAGLVENLGHLRQATGAHIMLIHHPGKDVSRGARGHSALRAAIDTEIVVKRDKDSQIITAFVGKQRDGATGRRFAYQLRTVELGRDADDDPVESCVVVPASPEEVAACALRSKPTVVKAETAAVRAQRAALDVLGDLLAKLGESSVPLDAWRAACMASGSLSEGRSEQAQRTALARAITALTEAEKITIERGRIRAGR